MKVWNILKQILSKPCCTIPSVLRIADTDYSGRELANLFWWLIFHFSAPTMSWVPRKSFKFYFQTYLPWVYIFITNYGDRNFNAMSSLKNRGACGDDELKIKPMKAIAGIICLPFSAICDKILSTGNFPARLKIARVLVIHKGGLINYLNNYRAISVLPIFSNVMETIIYYKLSNYFIKNNQ